MVVQTLGQVPPELQVTAEQDERLREQAGRVSPTDVVRVLDLIAAGLRAMKDGSDARTQLELALVKAAVPTVDASAKALQSRLERLEAGRPAPAPPPPGGRAADVPATAAGRAAEPPRTAPEPPADGAPREAAPAAPSAPSSPAQSVPASRAPEPAQSAPASPPATSPSPPAAEPEAAVAAVAVVEPEAGAEPVVAAVGLDLDAFAELWPAIIESIQQERPLLAEHLKVARPTALGDGELTLAWAETAGLSKRKAEDAANRELIGRAIRAVTGASLRLAHEMRAPEAPGAEAPTLSEDELIERFVEEFEAEILPAPEAETKSEETS
jgi:DNA polymerase-3 subunit gamma/tau